MCMMKLKIIQNNTIAVLVLPTHGFTVRVLSNLTQEIEEVLTRVQAYIADKLYHRQLDF